MLPFQIFRYGIFIIGPFYYNVWVFLMILCSCFAQWRHHLHGGGAGEPRGWKKAQASPAAATPPAVCPPAAQWPVCSPNIWCYRLVTDLCNKHKNCVKKPTLTKGGLCDCCPNARAATEVLLERHLEDILNNNRQAVIGAFQTEIKKTLKTRKHRKNVSQVSCREEILS